MCRNLNSWLLEPYLLHRPGKIPRIIIACPRTSLCLLVGNVAQRVTGLDSISLIIQASPQNNGNFQDRHGANLRAFQAAQIVLIAHAGTGRIFWTFNGACQGTTLSNTRRAWMFWLKKMQGLSCITSPRLIVGMASALNSLIFVIMICGNKIGRITGILKG